MAFPRQDPKAIIKDAISAASRNLGGVIVGGLGRQGYRVVQVDSADSNAVHLVIEGEEGAKANRVFVVTVREMK